ncbi:unnamed protein product [Schistocephalus solidus]|uniref:Endo/exonuclease/phosphatase domain-containing protein n=1 Tax=Schistocephalus solidus TaxID=70667 RepID=A0A183TL02_SCHSO|nr:unnamed protein product [Schistocephalus solidus]
MALPLRGIQARCGGTPRVGSGRASHLRLLPPPALLTVMTPGSGGGGGESAVAAAQGYYHFKLIHTQVTVSAPPFCGAYGGPRRTTTVELTCVCGDDARLLEELERLATRPNILNAGDFNAPHTDWSSTYTLSSELAIDGRLLRMTLKLFLTQLECAKANGLTFLTLSSGHSRTVSMRNQVYIQLPPKSKWTRCLIMGLLGAFYQMKAETTDIEGESEFSGNAIMDWERFRDKLQRLSAIHCPHGQG